MTKQAVSIFTLVVGLILFILHPASGQFGIRTAYARQTLPNWSEAMGNNDRPFGQGLEAGVFYWLRLKRNRIEFLPEFTYFRSADYQQGNWNNGRFSMAMLGIHSRIYALDMEGDCDCPTFSRQGPSFNKGLFFQLSAGGGRYFASADKTEVSLPVVQAFDAAGWAFRAGLGIGLDIGINDLITCSPSVTYYYYSGLSWEGIKGVGLTSTDSPRQLQLGLTCLFRPDYGRRRR